MTRNQPLKFGKLASSLLLAIAASALLLGCNFSDGQAPANPYFGGQWEATIHVLSGSNAGGSFGVTIWLVQDGDVVTGTFSNGGQLTGSLKGQVGGNKLSFEMVQDAPCPGQFFGVAYLDADALSGEYYGQGCQGELSAEFTAGHP